MEKVRLFGVDRSGKILMYIPSLSVGLTNPESLPMENDVSKNNWKLSQDPFSSKATKINKFSEAVGCLIKHSGEDGLLLTAKFPDGSMFKVGD